MVGNDVVDRLLATKSSNWKRTGYLDKLFNSDEQLLINEAKDPALLLWLMWTMKESAYKIVNRSTGVRTYAPLSFICSSIQLKETHASGKVSNHDTIFYTKSDIKSDLIHSIAVLDINHFSTVTIYYQSYRDSYLSDFNKCFSNFKLSKNTAGLPELMEIQTGKKLAVSISHHGHHLVIAYSGFPLLAN